MASAAAEGQSRGGAFCVPMPFPYKILKTKVLSGDVKSMYTRSTRNEYVR